MSKILLKLDQNSVTGSFYEELRIIGIVSQLTDYTFSWNIRRYTGVDFRIDNDKEMKMIKNNRNHYYSVFEYMHPVRKLVYYLYSNYYRGEYLLPELKKVDFLWLLKDDYVNDDEMSDLMSSIRRIPGVQLVNEVSLDKIKNKQHLLF